MKYVRPPRRPQWDLGPLDLRRLFVASLNLAIWAGLMGFKRPPVRSLGLTGSNTAKLGISFGFGTAGRITQEGSSVTYQHVDLRITGWSCELQDILGKRLALALVERIRKLLRGIILTMGGL